MLINQVVYDAKTGETRIGQVEVCEVVEEIPPIQEPTLEEQIAELKEINDIQDVLINTTMLATDEMFTMLEPLLSEVDQTLS